MAPAYALRRHKLSWSDEQIHAVTVGLRLRQQRDRDELVTKLDKKNRKRWISKITATSDQVAMTVFGLPELMELILLNLDPLENFRTMQTIRAMRDCVEISPRLKQHIGIISPKLSAAVHFAPTIHVKNGGRWLSSDYYDDPACLFLYNTNHADLSIGGFTFATFNQTYCYDYADWDGRAGPNSDPVDPRCLKTANFCVTLHTGIPDCSMGDRLKKLSPVNKAITRMDVFVKCDCCGTIQLDLCCMPATNGHFVTFGDMQNAAADVRSEHLKVCPKSHRVPDMWVHFIGRARLHEDDPIMVKRNQKWAAVKLYNFPAQDWSHKSQPIESEETDWELEVYQEWYKEHYGDESEAEAGGEEEIVAGSKQQNNEK